MREFIDRLKERYTKGMRVELISMNDPYSRLKPGDKGTIDCVDDMGTIFVDWDCGSGLGLIYGEDSFKII